MTTISAKIIKDSISPAGKRITTMQLRYPRFIHAELMTHRALSRNASSSRAIPVARLIQDVLDDPAVPLFWGKNQKGMQAGEECSELVDLWRVFEDDYPAPMSREEAWLEAVGQAVEFARAFDRAGYHKQIVNRLLEPFSHINVLVTATEWDNFYALRRHKDAEPHIHLLADRMWEAQAASTPQQLGLADWHLPFVTDEEMDQFGKDAIKISVARCASLSYLTVDGQPMTVERATALYEKLVGAQPLHASPAEHQAQAMGIPDVSGNFVGWAQYRKTLAGECINHYIPED